MELRADFWTWELWENGFLYFQSNNAVICDSSHRELMNKCVQGPGMALARSCFKTQAGKGGDAGGPGRQGPCFLSTLSPVDFLVGGAVG